MSSTPLVSTGAGTTTLPIPIATLVVFIILAQPLLFILIKHGRPGVMGWSILLAFCGVRIAGAALQIHAISSHSSNLTTSLILSNIGLSPLLLGSQGILHEARLARADWGRAKGINVKVEWIKVLVFHMVVVGGMVLLIIGVINAIDDLKPGQEVYKPDGLMKAGVLILLASWGVLAFMVLSSLKQARSDTGAWRDGTMLLHALIISLPLLGMRDVYSTLTTFISGTSFKNNLAAKVVLSTVPEMVIVALFVVAGVMTKDILRKDSHVKRSVNYESGAEAGYKHGSGSS